MPEDNKTLFTSFQRKIIIIQVFLLHQFLVPMWRCKKKIVFKYARLQNNDYILFLNKEKDTFQRHLPKHWRMNQTQRKEKTIIVNSPCYMLGTLPGAYSHSFKSFCANQWGSYYYYSPFPVRSLRHREVHFSPQNHTVKKKWYQDLHCSIVDSNLKLVDLTLYCF